MIFFYIVLLEDSRTSSEKTKSLERQIIVLQREKDQIKAENGKILLSRSKVEKILSR